MKSFFKKIFVFMLVSVFTFSFFGESVRAVDSVQVKVKPAVSYSYTIQGTQGNNTSQTYYVDDSKYMDSNLQWRYVNHENGCTKYAGLLSSLSPLCNSQNEFFGYYYGSDGANSETSMNNMFSLNPSKDRPSATLTDSQNYYLNSNSILSNMEKMKIADVIKEGYNYFKNRDTFYEPLKEGLTDTEGNNVDARFFRANKAYYYTQGMIWNLIGIKGGVYTDDFLNDLKAFMNSEKDDNNVSDEGYYDLVQDIVKKFSYNVELQVFNDNLNLNSDGESTSLKINMSNNYNNYINNDVTLKAVGGKIKYNNELKDTVVLHNNDIFTVVADQGSTGVVLTATAKDVNITGPTIDEYCTFNSNQQCLSKYKENGGEITLKASVSKTFGTPNTNPTPSDPTPTDPTPSEPEVVNVDLNISKVDVDNNQKLSGAHFILKDSNGTKVTEWDSTSSAKTVSVEADKRYELVESLSPAGYVSIGNSIYFKVDSSGKVTLYKNSGNTAYDGDNVEVSNKSIVVKNNYTKLSFYLMSSDTKVNLASAQFKICTEAKYNSDGINCKPDKTDWVWVSKTEPHGIDKLSVGTYYLIETDTPNGYIRKTSFKKFEVIDSNEMQRVDFFNTPTKVTIKKLDTDTKERVEGAKLQILDANGNIAKDVNGTELEWISRKDSDWEIYAIPVGDYTLVEKSIPDGYQEGMMIDNKVTGEYKFSVTEIDYDITIDVFNVLEKSVLTAVPNTAISPLNLFAIGGLMVFIGYETIKIYRKKVSNS